MKSAARSRSRTVSRNALGDGVQSQPKVPSFSHVDFTDSAAPPVELRFAAEGIADCDITSLSDPFAVISAEHFGIGMEELGRTETVRDELNPKWTSTIIFTHVPRITPTTLIVDVFDRDAPCDALERHDFLGRATFTVDDVMRAQDMKVVIPLLPSSDYRVRTFSKKPRGTLTVFGEYVRVAPLPERKVEFRMSAVSLRGKGLLKRDVVQFYEIQRVREEDGKDVWTPIYRSEDGTQQDSAGYVVFRPQIVTEQLLTNMQRNRKIRVAFYKRNRSKPHQLISYAETNADALITNGPPIPLEGCFGDDSGLGSLSVNDVWHHGNTNLTAVEMAADHFLHNDFVSTLNDKRSKRRLLRSPPSFISMR